MSTVQITDTFAVDKAAIHRTGDGYLVATPRVARVGIQEYLGREVGRPDLDRVRVYRSPEQVFSPDSMRSYAHRPVTNDHPPVPVNNKNWKKYAVGHTGHEVQKDGDFIRVPMMVADSASIEDFEMGKMELSLGYGTEIEWTPGTTDSGESYDAVQTSIRANHLALVKKARGGSSLRLGDSGNPFQFESESSREVLEDEYLDDMFNPDQPRVPAGSSAGGQFASAGEAQAYIDRNRERWKKAKVREVIEKSADVPAGFLPFLQPKHRAVHKRYIIKSGDADFTSAEPDEKTCGECGAKMPASATKCPKCGYATKPTADSLDSADGLSNVEDNTGESSMAKTIVVDGISCEMTDTAAQVVQRALDAAAARTKELADKAAADTTALQTAQAQVATLTTQIAAKDAEIATTKAVADAAKPTALQLDQMVAERTSVIGKGKQLIGDKLVVDGKTSAEIRRQVVDTVMGDVSRGWTDDQVTASFAVVGASLGDVKIPVPGVTDVAVGFGRPSSHQQPAKILNDAYAAYDAELTKGRAA